MDPRTLTFRRRLNLFAALLAERSSTAWDGKVWDTLDELLEPRHRERGPAAIPASVLEEGALAYVYLVPDDDDPPTL